MPAAGQPLRGLVGQSMSGARSNAISPNRLLDVSTGSGSITLTKTVTAMIFVFGGCGSGAAVDGGSPRGGSGGAALYKRVVLSAGSVISYSVGAGGVGVNATPGGAGNAGGDSTVTLPGGFVLRAAGGGNGGGADNAIATGGDVNRLGGSGGAAGVAGEAGQDGRAGSAAPSGSEGGGGGAAGLDSIISGLTYGVGGVGESTAGQVSGSGSNGRVLIMFIETAG